MSDDDTRVIKKYSNRRLYDTEQSCYITVDDVRQLVVDGVDFRVRNARDGEDITRTVLLQIILEQELLKMPMFSEASLRNIIMFHGSTMQSSLGVFLEQSMPMLLDMQKELADRGDLVGLDNNLWGELATMQGRFLSNTFQEYLKQIVRVYSDAQKRFSKGAEQMMKLSDLGFPLAPPAVRATKKGRKGG